MAWNNRKKYRYSRISNDGESTPIGGPYDVQPGICVIINNRKFEQKDEEILTTLFSSLKFNVQCHRNLTAKQIASKAKSYSEAQHKGVFFFIILSNGILVDNKEAVLGIDGEPVTIHQLKTLFHATNCPSLCNIPKIFLIDVCQGSLQETTEPSEGMATRESNTSLASLAHGIDTADFVIVYVSTNGDTVHPNDHGGQLTQTLVKAITEANSDKSFTKIIDDVITRIRRSDICQTAEFVDNLTRDYFIKSDTHMVKIQELLKDLSTAVEEWVLIRNTSIEKIHMTIENLRVHHKNVNISRITGSTVSIAGSAMAIVGFILTPFTLGVSLGLSIPGIALAVAGGGTAAGASIADIVLQHTNVKEAQKQLKHDYDKLNDIRKIAENIQKEISNVRQRCPGVSKTEFIMVFGEVLTQGLIRFGNLGIRLAELAVFSGLEIGAAALRIGSAAAKGVAVAGIVLNVVLIPLDLIEIVRSSVSIATGSHTKAMKQLTNLVEQLQQQKEAITGMLQEQTQPTARGAEAHTGKLMITTPTWKLPGVEESGQISVDVHSFQGQRVEWKGLKLHIHAGSLPEGLQQCTIFIKVSLAGDYRFPQGTSLVSAIYWLHCEPQCNFTKPITVEIQHCSAKQDLSKLKIVGAFYNQNNLPYKFKPLVGGSFSADSSYGAIEVKDFSGFGVVKEKSASERLYYNQLFYRSQTSKPGYDIYIVYTWNTEPHKKYVSEKYPEQQGFHAGNYQVVELEGDAIQVGLKRGIWTKVMDDHWEIYPTEPEVTKVELDDFKMGRSIPRCVLKARPLGEDYPQLLHKVSLSGVKPPYNELTLKLFDIHVHVPSSVYIQPAKPDVIQEQTQATDSYREVEAHIDLQMSSSSDNIKCPECLNLQVDPCTLPCGHIFCQLCLAHMWMKNKKICPVCKQTWRVFPPISYDHRANIESIHSREVEQIRREYSQKDKELIEKCLEAERAARLSLTSEIPAKELEETEALPDITWKLPGVEECGERSAVIRSSQGQLIEWNGLKLHIHAGSLPEGIAQCTIYIKVSLAGEYEFPEGTSLVSAVYWVRCEPQCNFTKPITVEIQHCSAKQDLSKLKIVRAFCSQKSLPYKFKALKGGSFDANTFYGAIEVNGFSGHGVTEEGPASERLYYNQLFYRSHISSSGYDIHITYSWNTEPHINYVNKEYTEQQDFHAGNYQVVQLDGAEIQVALERGMWTKVMNDRWEIYPIKPAVTKAELDDFKTGKGIPNCVLEARALVGDSPRLLHEITVNGIKSPHNILTLRTPEISVDDTHLSPRDFDAIYHKLEGHADKWRDIGRALGFKQEEMNIIQSNQILLMQGPPKSYLNEMLTQWLQWAPGDGRGSVGFATKESLRTALLRVNLGQLAQQFQ